MKKWCCLLCITLLSNAGNPETPSSLIDRSVAESMVPDAEFLDDVVSISVYVAGAAFAAYLVEHNDQDGQDRTKNEDLDDDASSCIIL